jgi:hypothetical protein
VVHVTERGARIDRRGLVEMRRLREEHPGDPLRWKAIDVWFGKRARWMCAGGRCHHIDHARAVAGIDAVGVGGDYDGVPTMGSHLTDVSTYPLVFAELRDRGYTDAELQQIAGRNVLRVMREVEKVADRLQSEREPSLATIGRLDGAAAG